MDWRKSGISAAAILCFIGILAPDAMASGFGLYVSGGNGTADTTYKSNSDTGGGDDKVKETSKTTGIGFVYDSNVLENRTLFNYRLNLGYEKRNLKIDDASALYTDEIKMSGVALEQDFGFGGKLGSHVRLWGGPCLRLSYHAGSLQGIDFKSAGIGVGPVLGVNVGLGRTVALSLRAGYLFNGYAGTWKDSFDDGTLITSERLAFANVSLLFRTGE